MTYGLVKNVDLGYKEKILAEKCEEWYRKYKSCNLEITEHAVK